MDVKNNYPPLLERETHRNTATESMCWKDLFCEQEEGDIRNKLLARTQHANETSSSTDKEERTKKQAIGIRPSEKTFPFISISKYKSKIYFMMSLYSIIAKIPLVIFEAFEYYCDYTYSDKTKLNGKNIYIIFIFFSIYLCICYKKYLEQRKIFMQTKNITMSINQLLIKLSLLNDKIQKLQIQSYIYMSMCNNNITSCKQFMIKDIYTKEKLILDENKYRQISCAETINKNNISYKNAPSSNTYNYLGRTDSLEVLIHQRSKNNHQAHKTIKIKCGILNISSESCLQLIEDYELWLGIIWLAYCFIDKFHEDKLPAYYTYLILSCGFAYVSLQIALSHQNHAEVGLSHLEKLAHAIDIIYSKYQRKEQPKLTLATESSIFEHKNHLPQKAKLLRSNSW